MWFLLSLLIVVLVTLSISLYMVYLTLYPKTKDYDETYSHEVEAGQFTEAYYEGLPKEDFYISSDQGYKLHGIWIAKGGSRKSVVLVHGYGFSLFGSMKYVPIFRRLGFNVLVYDHRYHGLSGGSNTTFGALEKEDLKQMIGWVKDKVGPKSLVGTHGESLGGATALMEGADDSLVDFIISDCAYARMDIELAYRLKVEYRLPAFPVIYIASVLNRFITGYFFDQVSPMASAMSIQVPTMLIHGTNDTYTPSVQGDMIYDCLTCPKTFYKVQGAGHAKSLNQDPEKYGEEIEAFLKKHKMI